MGLVPSALRPSPAWDNTRRGAHHPGGAFAGQVVQSTSRRGTARGVARVTGASPRGPGVECAAAVPDVERHAARLASPLRPCRPGVERAAAVTGVGRRAVSLASPGLPPPLVQVPNLPKLTSALDGALSRSNHPGSASRFGSLARLGRLHRWTARGLNLCYKLCYFHLTVFGRFIVSKFCYLHRF